MEGKTRSVLTADQAVQIFQARPIEKSVTHASIELAEKYSVSPKTVRDIWSGRSWYKETYIFDKTKPPLIQKLSKVPGRPKGSKDSRPRQRKTIDTTKSLPMLVADACVSHTSCPDQQQSSVCEALPCSARTQGQIQNNPSQILHFNSHYFRSKSMPSQHMPESHDSDGLRSCLRSQPTFLQTILNHKTMGQFTILSDPGDHSEEPSDRGSSSSYHPVGNQEPGAVCGLQANSDWGAATTAAANAQPPGRSTWCNWHAPIQEGRHPNPAAGATATISHDTLRPAAEEPEHRPFTGGHLWPAAGSWDVPHSRDGLRTVGCTIGSAGDEVHRLGVWAPHPSGAGWQAPPGGSPRRRTAPPPPALDPERAAGHGEAGPAGFDDPFHDDWKHWRPLAATGPVRACP
jgi:hypothetical protein